MNEPVILEHGRERMAPSQIKVHGRKRGHLKQEKIPWLIHRLESCRLPACTQREEILQAAGLDPQTSRICLEIGFGNGVFLSHLAGCHPHDLFIGVDLFLEGIAALARRMEINHLQNIRIHREPAETFLSQHLPAGCLDRVIINFPDPWPKKRHHKRRIIQPAFLQLLASRMRVSASLELATDWSDYAQWMMTCLENCPDFHNMAGTGHYAPAAADWTPTRFQEKGLAAGRPTWRLHFTRLPQTMPSETGQETEP